jgi:hypothetical protein
MTFGIKLPMRYLQGECNFILTIFCCGQDIILDLSFYFNSR